MIVDVPFVHWATVHRSRKKSPDQGKFFGRVTLEARETTSEKAPVAMWWISPRFNKDPYRVDGSRQVTIRSHEGRLYEPLRAEKGVPNVVDDDLLASCARPTRKRGEWKPDVMSAEGLVSVLTSGIATVKHDGREATTSLEDEIRKRAVVLESDFDVVAAEMARSVSRLLVVDGVVYSDIGRPMYSHQHTYRHELAPRHASEPEYDMVSMVRPEDYDGQVERMRKEKMQTDPSTVRLYRPDVVAPDLLEFDLSAWMVDGVARALLKDFRDSNHGSWRQGIKLSGYGRATIMGYGRLRDAVADGSSTEDVAQRIAEMGEAMRPHGTLDPQLRACEALARRIADAADVAPSRRR